MKTNCFSFQPSPRMGARPVAEEARGRHRLTFRKKQHRFMLKDEQRFGVQFNMRHHRLVRESHSPSMHPEAPPEKSRTH